MMLRQRTSRVVLLLSPRQTPSRGARTSSKSQEDEALSVIDSLGSNPPAVALDVPLLPEKPAPNLDIMHHYIPPAESPILRLLANTMMKDGKYAIAAKTTSDTLLHIHAMTRSKPMPIVEMAISLASPAVRLRKQKQGGGKTVLKPMALSERQRTSQGIKFLVDSADEKGKPGKTRAERLAREIMMTVQGESPAITKKSDLHKAAMVNRGNLPKRY
ncbi:hypothetical protein GALMADRAFT_115027 [Galerina marginata CBS 339.88]|uniref:Small ribosomal subunit protein uS7 domain-containing protein n=1 Tax=Galerina marginata (strain CBS 339.88) TaxID=685588 RepID=A0A067TIC4_GALM3|nr:hypothetical protein GALMADRAFT_115027 [Galerina marginata CBS 339.88]